MTRDEAIEKYTEKFGGYPHFLLMGASDEYVVKRVEESIRTGKEIEPEPGMIY